MQQQQKFVPPSGVTARDVILARIAWKEQQQQRSDSK
jgi:hypothetical protein